MRERDDHCFARGTVLVDTAEALVNAGDILDPIASGAWASERYAATLEALCRNQHPGRRSADEITFCQAAGTALEDVAAASLADDARAWPCKPPKLRMAAAGAHCVSCFVDIARAALRCAPWQVLY